MLTHHICTVRTVQSTITLSCSEIVHCRSLPVKISLVAHDKYDFKLQYSVSLSIHMTTKNFEKGEISQLFTYHDWYRMLFPSSLLVSTSVPTILHGLSLACDWRVGKPSKPVWPQSGSRQRQFESDIRSPLHYAEKRNVAVSVANSLRLVSFIGNSIMSYNLRNAFHWCRSTKNL
jgi:hypothetical protein